MRDPLAGFDSALGAFGVAVSTGSGLQAVPYAQAVAVRLERGTSSQSYALLYGPEVRLADAGRFHGHDLPSLIFTTFLSPRSAEALRRIGVQYVDTAGNAWVEFGDVLIDIRGRSRPPAAAPPKRSTAGNLFSAGRAQVVFALLAWPQLWDASQRELAGAAGVSLGQVHNARALLAEAGYGKELSAQTALLDLWAGTFPTGLAKKLALATYRGDVAEVRKAAPEDAVFVSGESAATDLLRPATLTLYVEELDPRLPIVNKWRSDGPGNILVRHKFWHAPDDSDAPSAGLRIAPWPLVYADLAVSDNPRVRSVAKEWRQRFAGPDQHA
ncbi:type IV toxin-antitoxin system AbiEi family antitoxin [Actinocorallia lasiicapitis]